MRLYAQTILIIGLTVLAVAAVLLITFELTVMGSLAALEQEYASEDLHRAENAIMGEAFRLSRISQDWAVWDDTYRYLHDRNTGYTSSNLVLSALSGLNIDALILYDLNGTIVQGIAGDRTGDIRPVPASLDLVLYQSGLLSSPKMSRSGIIMDADTPLIVASHPILTSEKEGPPRGQVVVVSTLDHEMVADLSRSILQNISLSPVSRQTTVFGPHSVISDINGAPALTLSIHEREDLSQSGLYSRFFLLGSLLLLTLLFMILASWLLNRIIIAPLQGLNRDLLAIGRSGSLSGRIENDRDDEIGDLAASINTMIGSIEEAQRERLSSEHRLARLVELVEEGICLIGPDNLIWFANATIGMIFETTPHSLNGTCLSDLLLNPETGDQDQNACPREITPGHHEFHTRTLTGRDLWVRVNIAPYPLDTGKMGQLCVITDITQFRTAERELLLSNKKLALLGSMTRHDIVNKLTTIRGMLGLIKRKNADTSLVQLIDSAEDAAEKINKHIEFSKEYQKAGIERPRWQDIRTVWNLAYAMSRRRGLTFTITGDNYEIYADQLLQKVFYNLIENTLRHGKDVFYITVTTRREGNDLQIIYEDDGGGIPEAMKDRIFDRGVGTGTGWGLFFVREVLDLTGMRIMEKGTYGIGAEFVITAPEGVFRPAPLDVAGEPQDTGSGLDRDPEDDPGDKQHNH